MIYFTSDTHFGSHRVLELSKRPFSSVEEMDQTIINNWNEIVGKDDIVYHLGDFGDYEKSNLLNGKIILIQGNYEEVDLKAKEGYFKIHNANFQFKPWDYITLPDGSLTFLNHYPIRHHDNKFNLFGHIHKLCMVKLYGLNVGTDCHNFMPINEETVLFYKSAIENTFENNVFK